MVPACSTVPELTRSACIKLNERVKLRVARAPLFLEGMGKKPSRIPDDSPSFADLYRMYDALLRLRTEVEAEEARARKTGAEAANRTDMKPRSP